MPVSAVTGASGHLGGNLVRELLARGREVRVLVREDTRALEGLDVEIVEGDVLDKDSLCRLMRGVGTVFHLAGRISIVGSEGGLVQATNVDGVCNVIEACAKGGVRRLVHCSSIHAYDSRPEDRVIDETRQLALDPGQMPYDRSKAMGQEAVRAAVKRGLDAVIVNPTAIIGPFDYKVSRMGRVLLDIACHRLPVLVDGGYNWVDVRDVTVGILAAEERGRSGESYLLSGNWVHICEVSEMVHRLTGRKTPRAATPIWLAIPASYFSFAWGRFQGKVPRFTPAAIRALRSHRLVSHEKASRELGFTPRPFEDTVRDTLEWFRQAGMFC